MLVVKKMGDWVTHISRSVIARLMMNMLAGVRRLRLLQHRATPNRKSLGLEFVEMGTQLETKLDTDTASETSAGPSEGGRSRTVASNIHFWFHGSEAPT